MHWSTNGLPSTTVPFSTTCGAELTATLDEDNGNIDTRLDFSCEIGAYSLKFTSSLPDVRSITGNSAVVEGGYQVSGPVDCYESLVHPGTISVTLARGDAAPMPTVVTTDFLRDFTIDASTTVDDGCIKATWSMTASFALSAGNVGYGAETCFTPI